MNKADVVLDLGDLKTLANLQESLVRCNFQFCAWRFSALQEIGLSINFP